MFSTRVIVIYPLDALPVDVNWVWSNRVKYCISCIHLLCFTKAYRAQYPMKDTGSRFCLVSKIPTMVTTTYILNHLASTPTKVFSL